MPGSKQKVRDRDYFGEYQKKSCYSVDQWMKIISNEAFVSPTELAILKEIFLSANHAASLSQLAFRHKKNASYFVNKMNQLASNIGRPNGYSVDVDLDGNEYWWYLLFWGKNTKLAGLEWKLIPELAEAIEYTYPELEDQYNSYMSEIERSEQIRYTKEDSVWIASSLLLFEKVYLEHPTDIYDLLLMQYEVSQRSQKIYGQDVDIDIITDNCNADSPKCVFPYLRDIDKYWRVCYPGEIEDAILRPEKIDYNAYVPSKFGFIKIKELCDFLETDYCKLTDPNYIEIDESNPFYKMISFLKENARRRYMDLTAPTEEDIERFFRQKERGKEALNAFHSIGAILTEQYPTFLQTEQASWLERDNTTIKSCWIDSYETKEYKGLGPTFSILCGQSDEQKGKIIFSVLLGFPIESPELTDKIMNKCGNLTVLTSSNFKVEKSIRMDSMYSSAFGNAVIAYVSFEEQNVLEDPLQDVMIRFETAIQILASYYLDICESVYAPARIETTPSVGLSDTTEEKEPVTANDMTTLVAAEPAFPVYASTAPIPKKYHFYESEHLDGIKIDDIDVRQTIDILNKRLAYFVGPFYQIDHQWFEPLKSGGTFEDFAKIMYTKVLPYLIDCFEDSSYDNFYQEIHYIFGDHKKSSPDYQFIRKEQSLADDLFGKGTKLENKELYTVSKKAFYNKNSYLEI